MYANIMDCVTNGNTVHGDVLLMDSYNMNGLNHFDPVCVHRAWQYCDEIPCTIH